MKRSQAISLVILAGAGVVAYQIAQRDPSQQEEDALIYRSEEECVQARQRTASDCRWAYEQARTSYLAASPRYHTLQDCQRHHGRAGCSDGAAVTPAATGMFVPLMAAYMMGRSFEQSMPPQPLYRHVEDDRQEQQGGSSSHGGGGYCTSAGGRVYAARSGSGAARVSSAVARTTTTSPRVVSRGGFGWTGRGMSASSHVSSSS